MTSDATVVQVTQPSAAADRRRLEDLTMLAAVAAPAGARVGP